MNQVRSGKYSAKEKIYNKERDLWLTPVHNKKALIMIILSRWKGNDVENANTNLEMYLNWHKSQVFG